MKKLFLIAFVVSLAATQPACPGPIKPLADAFFDCLGVKRPQIDKLLTEFRPLIVDGKADWDTIKQRGKQAGTDVGGCFVVEAVQLYLGGTKAPAPGTAWAAHQAYEDFRKEMNLSESVYYSTTCVRSDGTTSPCKL